MSRKWACPTRIHLNNRELHKNVEKSAILKSEIKEERTEKKVIWVFTLLLSISFFSRSM